MTIYQLPYLSGSSYFSTAITGWYFTPFLHLMLNFVEVNIRRYDIIHSFQASTPSIGIPTIFSKVFRNKIVFVDQDDAWRNGFAAGFNPVKRLVYETLEDYLPLYSADTVTVATEYLQHKTVSIGVNKNKVQLLPNGAEIDKIVPVDKKLSRKKLRLDPNSKILMSIGHYAFPERYCFLFEAISRIIDRVPELNFIIVGEQKLPTGKLPYYNDIISHVHLAGFQPYEELKYYLSAADIAVLPMADTTIEKARFPGRLGEYLAAGRPIVSNAVGDVKKILESHECGLTSDPNDIDAFAENIMRLLCNVKLQERLGKNARKTAEERYSWDKIAKGLNGLYDNVSK